MHNVRNHTGWHVQLFHGPSNGAQLKSLFADLVALNAITFTDLGSDYMEDWQRLSSMMLLDNFWQSGAPTRREATPQAPVESPTTPWRAPEAEGSARDLPCVTLIRLSLHASDTLAASSRLALPRAAPCCLTAVVGQKVLVFQPDSAMCANSDKRIGDFLQYDYVGAPMAGPWWMTNDMDSQWSVGCGGFSLRDREKSILMSRTPQCVTPAAGKLEDQQLGTMWKYLIARCANAGIHVRKPSRFDAVKFGVEYDLQMDVLPGEDASMPNGCRANYYTGPKYDPGHRERGKPPKWHPQPMPANVQCDWRQFVPMGCHKCWHWNWYATPSVYRCAWPSRARTCIAVHMVMARRKLHGAQRARRTWLPTHPCHRDALILVRDTHLPAGALGSSCASTARRPFACASCAPFTRWASSSRAGPRAPSPRRSLGPCRPTDVSNPWT